MRLRLVIVTILALTGSSCALVDDDTATVRSDGSPVVSPVGSPVGSSVGEPASPTVAEHELTRGEIDMRRAAWRETALTDYSYSIAGSCVQACDRAGTFTVTVTDGAVLDVDRVTPEAEPYRRYRGQSIEEMFAMFEEALFVRDEEDGTGVFVSAGFNAETGHPTSFTVRWGASTTYHGIVSDLTSIDEPIVEEPEPTVSLSVSNQALTEPPVRITVMAGDQQVVDAGFEAVSHGVVPYDLDLAPGAHELRIAGGSAAALTRTIVVGPDELLYLRVTYWPGDHTTDETPSFTVDVRDEPFFIM